MSWFVMHLLYGVSITTCWPPMVNSPVRADYSPTVLCYAAVRPRAIPRLIVA